VIDRAPGDEDAALLAKPHYRQTRRLFAYDGQAPKIHYGVEPKWRGVTPFIALLRPGQPPRWQVGAPTDADIASWAAPG
jgi:hypothetical protein